MDEKNRTACFSCATLPGPPEQPGRFERHHQRHEDVNECAFQAGKHQDAEQFRKAHQERARDGPLVTTQAANYHSHKCIQNNVVAHVGIDTSQWRDQHSGKSGQHGTHHKDAGENTPNIDS